MVGRGQMVILGLATLLQMTPLGIHEKSHPTGNEGQGNMGVGVFLVKDSGWGRGSLPAHIYLQGVQLR